MALAFPLTIPSSPGWVNVDLIRVGNRTEWPSVVTQVQQIILRPGTHWRFAGSLPLMNRVQASPWRGFIGGLRNGAGTFELPVPDYPGPLGATTVNGLVKGAAQTGVSLETDGWTASQTGVVKAGDFAQVEAQCYEIVKDADSDVSGNVTLELNMEIRTSHADNAVVNVLTPKILMYDPEAATSIMTDRNGNVLISINGREVVV